MGPRDSLAAAARGGNGVTELESGLWLVTDPTMTERLLASQAARTLRSDLETTDTSWGPEGLTTWMAVRRVLRPALAGPGVARYVPEIADQTRRIAETWPSGGLLDPVREAIRLVSEVNTGYLLGAPSPALSALVERELSLAKPVSPLLRPRRMLQRAQRATHAAISDHVRRGSGLAAVLADHGFDERTRTLALRTMLLSSHHVPAAALAWAFHELSAHPEIQRQARAEARTHAHPTAGLQLCGAIVREVLRLHPPVRQLQRKLDGPTFRFPQGSILLFSPYLNQRDPCVYPAPHEFRPSRWHSDTRPAAGSYFPFALGPRFCPGARLALTELTVILATVLRTHHLEPHRQPTAASGLPDFPRRGLLRVRPIDDACSEA